MSTMSTILANTSAKPYLKLGQLISFARFNKLITKEEAEAFDEELGLLQRGINRSHNSHPRAYMDNPLVDDNGKSLKPKACWTDYESYAERARDREKRGFGQ